MNTAKILHTKLLVFFFVPPIFVLLFILLQIFSVEHVAGVNKFHVIIISTQPGPQRTLVSGAKYLHFKFKRQLNAEDGLLEMTECVDLHSLLRDICSGILDGGKILSLVVVVVGTKCLSNATTCPCGLRGPPSWVWQDCNRLLRRSYVVPMM